MMNPNLDTNTGYRQLIVFALSIFLCPLHTTPLAAQAAAAAAAAAPSAVRVAITNGVINLVNNVKQTTVQLDWSLLPPSEGLEGALLDSDQAVEVTTFEIPNEELGHPDRLQKRLLPHRDLLRQALAVNNLRQVGTPYGASSWRARWLNLPGRDGVRESEVQAGEYYSLLRDHALFVHLLTMQSGFYYRMVVVGGQLRGLGRFDTGPGGVIQSRLDDLTWTVRVFRFSRGNPEHDVFRYTIVGRTQPLTLQFLPTEGESVRLRVQFRASTGPQTIGLAQAGVIDMKEVTVKVEPVLDKKLEGLKASSKQNTLTAELQTLTGEDAGGLFSRGLLGGSTRASIVSGGLFGDDEIDPVIGANFETGEPDSLQFGGLLGVSLDGDSALYVGPSVRANSIVVSAGARMFDEVDATGKKDTEIGFGGLVSVDLSRITGSRADNKTLQASNPSQGGGWGVVSDEVAGGLGAFDLRIQRTAGTGDFQLVRVKKADRSDPAESERAVLRFRAGDDPNPLVFTPNGDYQITCLTPNHQIFLAEGPGEPGDAVPDGHVLPTIGAKQPVTTLWVTIAPR